jgi:hypothetical protein
MVSDIYSILPSIFTSCRSVILRAGTKISTAGDTLAIFQLRFHAVSTFLQLRYKVITSISSSKNTGFATLQGIDTDNAVASPSPPPAPPEPPEPKPADQEVQQAVKSPRQ